MAIGLRLHGNQLIDILLLDSFFIISYCCFRNKTPHHQCSLIVVGPYSPAVCLCVCLKLIIKNFGADKQQQRRRFVEYEYHRINHGNLYEINTERHKTKG